MPRALAPASPPWTCRSAALALALAVGLAAPAAAQHPAFARARAIHARLAASDVVAVATVEQVSEGRIRLGDARGLYGRVPRQFQLKRSPSNPPPLAAGDRALLLLEGARPPYLLLDRPEETIRLADAASEALWVEAFEAWLRARERPAEWPALYAGWIESGPDTLRELAVVALGDPAAPFQPLPAAFAASFGDAAWDPERPLAVRRAAAAVAVRSAPGAVRLATGFASADGEPDAALSLTAVSVAALLGGPGRDAAFLRGLAHVDAEVRRSVLRALEASAVAPAPAVRARTALVAKEDPESWLRTEAERVLALLDAVAPPS